MCFLICGRLRLPRVGGDRPLADSRATERHPVVGSPAWAGIDRYKGDCLLQTRAIKAPPRGRG